MEDNEYDISDYKNIVSEFGSLEDFENLIKESQRQKIKIMMDLVVSHTSIEHYWFQDVLKNPESKYKIYCIWRNNSLNDAKSLFGGSAWEYVEELGQYYFHLFGKGQLDLNWENESLVETFLE